VDADFFVIGHLHGILLRNPVSASRSILVAGATGLVGTACTYRLLEHSAFHRVVVLSRSPLPDEIRERDKSAKLEEHVIDFDTLAEEKHGNHFEVDQILCCLGTTLKKAGTKARFRKVDFGYPKHLAEIGYTHNVHHFLLVSAMGSHANSWIFYNRVKGELEAAVLKVPFPSITIVRPSLLLGERDENRRGEEIAKRLQFLIPGKYKPVEADVVGRVLIDAACENATGHRYIDISGRRVTERWC